MKEVIAWVVANKEAVVGIVASTLGLLALIAKLTPSPRDDSVIAKIMGWLKLVPKAK
jgi:hypothetical protein